MASWNELLDEVEAAGRILDLTRKKYLSELEALTHRNVIVYYSGWLQKSHTAQTQAYVVNDSDKNGLMAVVYGLDRNKGLDLILHTPGGYLAAAESLVEYLHAMFGKDIRAVIPQIAMSAGTMMALACKQIVMGKHSNLGPIDPQIAGLPAHAIVEEFDTAKSEILANPQTAAVWQPIIAKYSPTLIGQCQKAIAWSQQMVKSWLLNGMFDGDPEAESKAEKVLLELGDPSISKSHARHVGLQRAKDIGLEIVDLEADQGLQSAVLTVHHACILTLAQTSVTKLIENHQGISHVSRVEVARAP